MRKDDEEEEAHKKSKSKKDGVPHYARTVYPADYSPPKIDDDPIEIHETKRSGHYDTEYHTGPYPPALDKHEPIYDRDHVWNDDEVFMNDRSLRELHERGERMAHYAEEARQHYHYKRPIYDDHRHFLNLVTQSNEDLGHAMMENNEQERALELWRVAEEQTLKEEYDTKIMELTKDYRSKLQDLDRNYTEKRLDLDRHRQEIERASSIAHDEMGRPYALDSPDFTFDPEHEPLHRISGPPVMASPETQTFNDTEFEFGAENAGPMYLNLEQQQQPKEPHDPLADIKRRERDLQHERLARETELQRDYEKRLAEFEEDYKQKERELEKEKLYQERKLIAEREHQIELENQEARKARKAALPDYDDEYDEEYDDEGANSDEEDESEEESENLEDYEEDGFDLSSEENGPIAFSDEDYDDGHKEDVYEIEWELDLVPKRVVPKDDARVPTPETKKSKKDRKK